MSLHRRLHPTLGALVAALALAPAANAGVTVETQLDSASERFVDIEYSTVANLSATREGSSIVVAAPNGPDPGFVGQDGCVVENSRRVVCGNSPRSVQFHPFAVATDTDDVIVIGSGIFPPRAGVFTGKGNDRVDVSGAQQIGGAGDTRRWRIDGGEGDDRLIGGDDFEKLDGGPGNDELVPRERLTSAGDELSGGPGVDTLDLRATTRTPPGSSRSAATRSWSPSRTSSGRDGRTTSPAPTRPT